MQIRLVKYALQVGPQFITAISTALHGKRMFLLGSSSLRDKFKTAYDLLDWRKAPAIGTSIRNRHVQRKEASGPNKPTRELTQAVTEQEERDELEAQARPDTAPADAIESARHAQRNARTCGGNTGDRATRRPAGTAPGAAPPEGPSTAEI